MRRRLLPFAALLLAFATPTTAAALTPVAVRGAFSAKRINGPKVAALPDGRAAVGWTDNGSPAGTFGLIRPANGLLPATPQLLLANEAAEGPQLLPGPATAPLLTSFDSSDGGSTVGLAGDAFAGRTIAVSGNGRFLQAARCPNGTTVLTRQNSLGGSPQTYRVFGALFDETGTMPVIGPGITVNNDAGQDSNTGPQPTCTKDTDPLVAWNYDPDGASSQPRRLLVADLKDTSSIMFDRTVPAGSTAGTPLATTAADGRIWIVWSETAGGATTTYVASRAAGLRTTIPTSSPTVLDTTGFPVRLFLGAGGTTHLLRATVSGSNLTYSVRTAPAGADAFGAGQQLAPPGPTSFTVLTGHPDGAPRLLVNESTPDMNRYSIQGLPAAGSSEPRTATGIASNGGASFAYLPTGDLLGVGVDRTTTPESATLTEGGLDTGVPPTLANVAVPGLAAPGEATPLSVDAVDALGLGSFTWSVDGATLTEQHTTYRFTKPGSYEVKARAVDRAGNAAEISRTVRVLDPNAVAPGTTTSPPGTTPVPDTTKPSLKAAAKRGKKGKAKRAVSVAITAGEVAAADLELIGTLKRGKQKGTLVLKSARVKALTAGKAKTLKLSVPAALAKLVKNTLRVRVTLTDLAGNRTVKTVSVKRR